MLEIPPTIRLPQIDELPNNPEVFERLKEREHANIVEGYKLINNTTHDLPFSFYAEINVDNSRLWDLFKAIVGALPDEISCIYNLYDNEAIFSDYRDKKSILAQLENYKTEITQDCNLEIGLIYQTDDTLEEVFIPESKYLKVWSNNEVDFRQLMKDFNLSEISNINFIDEFPKVVEPLTTFNKNTKRTDIIIEELNDFFNKT